jgi:hypothetical protein
MEELGEKPIVVEEMLASDATGKEELLLRAHGSPKLGN